MGVHRLVERPAASLLKVDEPNLVGGLRVHAAGQFVDGAFSGDIMTLSQIHANDRGTSSWAPSATVGDR